MNDYQKIVRSWVMYDWANSAFATTVMAAVFPPFYRSLAIAAGKSEVQATAYWAYTTAIALLLVALAGPLIGTFSDLSGGKKKFLAAFAVAGIFLTASLSLLTDGEYLPASLLFICANFGFAASIIFYESLLPYIAMRGDIDQISARGYAVGYLGGGILLVMNLFWIMRPDWFFLSDSTTAIRAALLSVAVWWAVFSIPLLRNVPEPANATQSLPVFAILRSTFSRLIGTFREISKYRQILLFLVAYWIYNDGIGTIIKMATAYGDEIGVGRTDLIAALVITQFVGIPCTLLFGQLAGRIGAKPAILIGLGVYVIITLFAFYLNTAFDFYMLAILVGTVQGGTQALSRSFFGAMVPRERSAEFFGFYSTSSKFAGIFGPLLFGAVSQATGNSRISIISLLFFFVFGGLLLLRVKPNRAKLPNCG